MKTPEDINRLRDISNRLRELGIPKKTITALDRWIDGEERTLHGSGTAVKNKGGVS